MCDEYVWDCDHLIDERLSAARVPAIEGSQLQAIAYDGKQRVLEIEFRVNAPFANNDVPLPPPPRVIQYFDVPRYALTKLRASRLDGGKSAIGKTTSECDSGVRRYEPCVDCRESGDSLRLETFVASVLKITCFNYRQRINRSFS